MDRRTWEKDRKSRARENDLRDMLLRRLQRMAMVSSVLRRGKGGVGDNDVIPILKRKASNSWSAVQDTYIFTKDIFERHKVVFTISTSLASILTAWAGYSLRHYHQSNVEKRLESIEQAMKSNSDLRSQELRQIVGSGSVSSTTYVTTAFTTFAISYVLGWRGGSWYTRRKFRKEQLKALGQTKPNKWKIMRRRLDQSRIFGGARKPKETTSSVSVKPPHMSNSDLAASHISRS